LKPTTIFVRNSGIIGLLAGRTPISDSSKPFTGGAHLRTKSLLNMLDSEGYCDRSPFLNKEP